MQISDEQRWVSEVIAYVPAQQRLAKVHSLGLDQLEELRRAVDELEDELSWFKWATNCPLPVDWLFNAFVSHHSGSIQQILRRKGLGCNGQQ